MEACANDVIDLTNRFLGSGYVKAVGSKVTVAKPGDAVLLSFDSCEDCATCKRGTPSLCYKFIDLNFGLIPAFFKNGSDLSGKADLSGRFFGQSSFANHSVVSEKSVVNATDLVKSKEELALFSPLGCGIQTGCGTVTNVIQPHKDDVIAVQGLGGVGLSAVMGAKIEGCRMIIGIDRVESRLALAKELGCTHVIDTSKLDGKTVTEVIQEMADGVGPNATVETTGVPALITAAVEYTRQGGRIIQVGSAPPDFEVKIPAFHYMCGGKSYQGAIEGNSIPRDMVPRMIQWYREGRFPVDKLIKTLPADDFERGLHEMHTGETIKPVLLW